MNKYEEVAKIFGKKLGEKFNIVFSDPKRYIHSPFDVSYKFTEDGLVSSKRNNCGCYLLDLLEGTMIIKDMPFKPKHKGKFYAITEDGGVDTLAWYGGYMDYTLYNMGNVFRTAELALAHKQEMLDKLEKIKGELNG